MGKSRRWGPNLEIKNKTTLWQSFCPHLELIASRLAKRWLSPRSKIARLHTLFSFQNSRGIWRVSFFWPKINRDEEDFELWLSFHPLPFKWRGFDEAKSKVHELLVVHSQCRFDHLVLVMWWSIVKFINQRIHKCKEKDSRSIWSYSTLYSTITENLSTTLGSNQTRLTLKFLHQPVPSLSFLSLSTSQVPQGFTVSPPDWFPNHGRKSCW